METRSQMPRKPDDNLNFDRYKAAENSNTAVGVLHCIAYACVLYHKKREEM